MSSPLGLTGKSNNDIGTYNGNTTGVYNSIINGSRFYYRPPSVKGNESVRYAVSSSNVHRGNDVDDIYDTSITSLVNYTGKYNSMRLKYSDFAYLRDLGVYPNNRLIIARRFPTPIGNDLTSIKQVPLSTIIGWVKEDAKSFGLDDITFNEVWEKGDASLQKILNEMLSGGESGAGGGAVGSLINVATNSVPLPGFTRGFQYEVLKNMGVAPEGNQIPEGNPNFLQESKRRKTISTEDNDSPLESSFVIDLETVYEQKFINNVDPSVVFLDIIGNLLRFGTSKSEFFITGEAGGKIKEFMDKFKNGQWMEAMSIILDAVTNAVKGVLNTVKDMISSGGTSTSESDEDEDTSGDTSFIDNLLNSIGEGLLSKYKVRIGSIVAAWTGEASAPWHVTIGNPKKPFFSSGDMICRKVSIKFGTVLAFNDMPSTIAVKVTLEPARNLGLQEIFERFNTGAGRSYIALSDTFESNTPNTLWNYASKLKWKEEPANNENTENNPGTTNGTGNNNRTGDQEKAVRGATKGGSLTSPINLFKNNRNQQ